MVFQTFLSFSQGKLSHSQHPTKFLSFAHKYTGQSFQLGLILHDSQLNLPSSISFINFSASSHLKLKGLYHLFKFTQPIRYSKEDARFAISPAVPDPSDGFFLIHPLRKTSQTHLPALSSENPLKVFFYDIQALPCIRGNLKVICNEP